MKRFYENTLKRLAQLRALRVVTLLCVLLGVSGSAWAGAGFWGNQVIEVQMKDGSHFELGNDYAQHDLGTLQSAPIIEWVKVKMWKDGSGNLCYDDVKIIINGTTYNRSGNVTEEGDNRIFEMDVYNLTLPSTTSTIQISATAKGNSSGTDGCNETFNTGTYSIKYTIEAGSTCEAVKTIYFKNTVNWNKVYAYLYPSDYWNQDNGVGSKSLKAGPLAMTLVSGSGTNAVYKCDYAEGHSGYIAFTEAEQRDYDYFYDTKAAYRGDLCASSGNMFVPSTTSNGTWNGGHTTYYSDGEWQTYSLPQASKLYLQPEWGDDDWNKDGAWFAAHIYNNSTQAYVDVRMTPVDGCETLYSVDVPSGYTHVVFRRMNAATQDFCQNWNECTWAKTNDLAIPTDNNVQYTMTSWGNDDGSGINISNGEWGPYTCQEVVEDCNRIEIWARGKGGWTDMNLSVSSGDVQQTSKQNHNGIEYKTWTVSASTDISVSFCAEETYCTNAQVLTPGNRYYCEFAAADWGGTAYTITMTEPLDCADGSDFVWLSKQASVNKNTKKATLYGYLSLTDCSHITEYGFYYCEVEDGQPACRPTAQSTAITVTPSHELLRGEEFEDELQLVDGKTYYYRAYAVINGQVELSQEIRSISADPCEPQACCGGTIVYTIDASLEKENSCKLQFKTLQNALDHLQRTVYNDDAYQYAKLVNGSYNLQQPVEMQVAYYDDDPLTTEVAYQYRGTPGYSGMTAGSVAPNDVNLIENFNKEGAVNANTLTITNGSTGLKPWIHHIIIRNSKNIVLDNLCIYSDIDGTKDNALEIDVNSTDWPNVTPAFTNANITIQNCIIGSAGFTGVHVSGYDGLVFKGNDIEASFANQDDRKNTLNWGASAKFMACSNIKFIQNNFRGSQPTLLWIQDSQHALFMNNVFWNTNTFLTENVTEVTPTAIKLVAQYDSRTINNIGFFYNTFYFEDNKTSNASSSYYNFFTQYIALDNDQDGSPTAASFGGDIYFQYNNCYSYDTDCPGSNAFLGKGVGGGGDAVYSILSETTNSNNFCPNNFWSVLDADNSDPSGFDFTEGCDSKKINVKSQVCETSATGPASLKVKGELLNLGIKPDYSRTNIALTDDELYADRYNVDVRPDGSNLDKKWTYGAYQSKGSISTNKIYWVGVSEDWDNRNNWEFEVQDASGKVIRDRVSCINDFTDDLQVVIEETTNASVPNGRKWPKVPASFNAKERTDASGIPAAELVSAGLGTIATPTQFAGTIELMYGAGIKGVENLVDANGNKLYNQAIVHFDADRDMWLLVGNIVKPYDAKTGTYRNVKSGDYYLNHLPQVYMHKAKVEGNDVTWGETFASLEEEVHSNEVYAINVTKYYGTQWFPASVYDRRFGTSYKNTADLPHPYTFTGRFAVEEDKGVGNTNYVYETTAGKNLLNNIYPCNLDAKEIEELGWGTINIYNYVEGSFESTSARSMDGAVYIKAQNGFVFTPAADQTLTLTDAILAEGSTRTRSVDQVMPTYSLRIDNANTTAPGASNVVVRYDEMLDGTEASALNTPKVFTQNQDTPEAYILFAGGKLTRLQTGNMEASLPLGISLKKAMNITFETVYNEGYAKAILLDAKTGKQYDLLTRSYTTEVLPEGELEGRFFLNVEVKDADDYIEDSDSGITTDVEESVTDLADINIYTVDANAIRVVTSGTELQTIYVSDMTGRTQAYQVSGNYAELQLPVAQGVYLVQVISDKVSRTEKVVLK